MISRTPRSWPEAWVHLSKRQKEAYKRWRLLRDPNEAKHIWPQTLGNIAIPSTKNVGFLQRAIREAYPGLKAILRNAVKQQLRGL